MSQYDPMQKLPIEKVFRDPIHDYIHIQHQLIRDLIDTKEFQRLRRIKQLGTNSYTFHGAEHSRFSHSLGVYEIARRICDVFARNYPVSREGINGWDDNERLLTLCAALLHDIGHGPFSHTFEKIFKTDHEQMTVDIITSKETEVNQVLLQVSEDFPEKVASVIDKTYPNQQVVQMISSQIDADRMDYLQRDAYFTGVTYGDFDFTRILRVIRPYKNGIGFLIQGKHAVEDYIVSRYQMYQQVYFHPASRGMEVTLKSLLSRAKDLYEAGNLDMTHSMLRSFFDSSYSLLDYIRLDDSILLSQFMVWVDNPDEILSNLSQRFLNRNPLKSVTYEPDEDSEIMDYLTGLVEDAGFNPTYYVDVNSSFDQPYDFYHPDKGDTSKTQIELIEDDGTLIELSEESDLVRTLSGSVHGDQRFYVPKEFLSKHRPQNVNLFEPLIDEFQDYIKNGAIFQPSV